MTIEDLQNNGNSFDPAVVTHDDFLDQMISGLQTTPWDFDDDDQSKLQIAAAPPSALKSLQLPNHHSSFKSPIGDNNAIQNPFHGFTGSVTSNQTQQFRNLPAQNFGSPGAVMQQTGSGGGSAPRQRVRARRGQATDPHSIAERLRRERIAERMKALQELVPNANKTDKASMLDEIIDYVKFLQLQVKVLSMSRLGGVATGTGAPIAAEGGVGCEGNKVGRSSIGMTSSLNSDTMVVTENQVVKLMEEDMGSAMQYLQGKGLCLMPISLATAISTATSHPSGSRNNCALGGGGSGEGCGPSSPNLSVLTVQSANRASVKDSP